MSTPPTTDRNPRRKRRPEVYTPRGHLLPLPSGRTGEGRRLRELKAGLLAHVGENPTVTQRILVNRAVSLQQHLTAMDRRFVDSGGQMLSEHAGQQYIAWSNAMLRTLIALGLEKPKPSPAAFWARIHGHADDAEEDDPPPRGL